MSSSSIYKRIDSISFSMFVTLQLASQLHTGLVQETVYSFFLFEYSRVIEKFLPVQLSITKFDGHVDGESL